MNHAAVRRFVIQLLFLRYQFQPLVHGHIPGFAAVRVELEKPPQRRTRNDQFVRQAVHLLELPVRNHQSLVRIEQAKALRHVADGDIEARICPRQRSRLRGESVGLPYQQKRAEHDDADDRNDQQTEYVELPIPPLQHVAAGVGHRHHQRQPGHRLVAYDASRAVNDARCLVGAGLRHRQIFGKQRAIRERCSKHIL